MFLFGGFTNFTALRRSAIDKDVGNFVSKVRVSDIFFNSVGREFLIGVTLRVSDHLTLLTRPHPAPA